MENTGISHAQTKFHILTTVNESVEHAFPSDAVGSGRAAALSIAGHPATEALAHPVGIEKKLTCSSRCALTCGSSGERRSTGKRTQLHGQGKVRLSMWHELACVEVRHSTGASADEASRDAGCPMLHTMFGVLHACNCFSNS